MSVADKDFDRLVEVITSYCGLLSAGANSLSPHRQEQLRRKRSSVAREITQVFNEILPELTKAITDFDLPTLLYVEKIIGFGVAGLRDRSSAMLWEKHWLGGESISEVAHQLDCPKRSIYRKLAVFSERVAKQLWEKNRELASPRRERALCPQTFQQRQAEILKEKFHLTDREAEVLLMYCRPGPHIGQRAIAASLGIKTSTLKTYRRLICRKLSVRPINEAANVAKKVLQGHLGDKWWIEKTDDCL